MAAQSFRRLGQIVLRFRGEAGAIGAKEAQRCRAHFALVLRRLLEQFLRIFGSHFVAFGQEQTRQHDPQAVGRFAGRFLDRGAKQVSRLVRILPRLQDAGAQRGGAGCFLEGQVFGQGVGRARGFVDPSCRQGHFAEDESFFGGRIAIGQFFSQFGHAGHVARPRGMQRDPGRHALVLEGHQGGLTQKSRCFRAVAPIDGLARLVGDG